MPKVWHVKDAKAPKDAVYVGRPSKFGNPFYLSSEANRDACVEQYRHYLMDHPILRVAAIKELRGKDLMCWCAPRACHADVLLEIANK